jgi:hypothetical protein
MLSVVVVVLSCRSLVLLVMLDDDEDGMRSSDGKQVKYDWNLRRSCVGRYHCDLTASSTGIR